MTKEFKEKLEYIIALLPIRFIGWLPYSLAVRIGRFLGLFAYYVLGRLKRLAIHNLKLAYQDRFSEGERENLIKKVFSNLGLFAAQFCQFKNFNRENISNYVSYEGAEIFDLAWKKGQGVIFLTAHYGNWEFMAFAQAFLKHYLNIIIRPANNHLVDRLINEYRTFSGNRVLAKKESFLETVKLLRKGESVGILMDQSTHPAESVFVEFFGHKVSTSPLLALLALRTKAAVIPVFCEPLGEEKIKIVFEPEVQLIRTGRTKQDILENTALFTKVIENRIRKNPANWLWLHNRWKNILE